MRPSVFTCARSFLQGKIDGGVVILSRYPIVESDVYKFNRGVFGDRYANHRRGKRLAVRCPAHVGLETAAALRHRLVAKSIVYAKVLVAPLRHVHVFATHLQASYLK